MVISGKCKVAVHYTLKLDDGEQVETSAGGEPLEFEFGSGQIIPGLEKALEGMAEGEKKTVVVPPEDGYGPRDPEGFVKMPRSEFPEDEKLQQGMMLRFQREDGAAFTGVVLEISETEVTLDFNHPLAGMTLHFDVEIVTITPEKSLIIT